MRGADRASGPAQEAAVAARSEPNQRYFALDFLRGSLMLLGIIFHTALPYAASDLSDGLWPTTEVLSYVVVGSHDFRIPLFFVLAGFSAALLLSRRTRSEFVKNRLIRIGLPLSVGWIVLVPLVVSGFHFSVAAGFFSLDFARDLTWGVGRARRVLLPGCTESPLVSLLPADFLRLDAAPG